MIMMVLVKNEGSADGHEKRGRLVEVVVVVRWWPGLCLVPLWETGVSLCVCLAGKGDKPGHVFQLSYSVDAHTCTSCHPACSRLRSVSKYSYRYSYRLPGPLEW